MIEANASHRSRSVVSFGASRWCHDFALPSDLHRLTIRRSIPVLLPVTPFCIRFNDDQSNAFRSYSAIGGTRTPTRSVCGFEHEYHFIEYEYDFSGTEVAISEKCRKSRTIFLIPPGSPWREKYEPTGPPRAKHRDIKRVIVRLRGYKHLELQSEEAAEFSYRPLVLATLVLATIGWVFVRSVRRWTTWKATGRIW